MTGHAETLITPAVVESRTARVQNVRSPGGIEAWLVEDYAIPLIAVNFAFRGGAAQDPLHKPGIATMLAGLLDEGAGPLDSAAFHQALEDQAIELSFSRDADAGLCAGRGAELRQRTVHGERHFGVSRCGDLCRR